MPLSGGAAVADSARRIRFGGDPRSLHRRRVARPGSRRDRHRASGRPELDRAAIDADLHRRQQGYGRSPRQQLEQDEVEVLAGLRHGRTLGTPLALVVRNRDHKNWEWGMNPWPPEGEPSGKGTKPVTLPRPGHADLAGRAQVRARGRPERAGAGKRPSHGRLCRCGCSREGAADASSGSRLQGRCSRSAASERAGRPRSTPPAPTATRSAGSSRCARVASSLGSAPTRPVRIGSTGDSQLR